MHDCLHLKPVAILFERKIIRNSDTKSLSRVCPYSFCVVQRKIVRGIWGGAHIHFGGKCKGQFNEKKLEVTRNSATAKIANEHRKHLWFLWNPNSGQPHLRCHIQSIGSGRPSILSLMAHAIITQKCSHDIQINSVSESSQAMARVSSQCAKWGKQINYRNSKMEYRLRELRRHAHQPSLPGIFAYNNTTDIINNNVYT